MKRKILIILLSIMTVICLSIGISACGTKIETDGVLNYSLNKNGGYSVVGLADETTTEITIPATFNEKSVVSIGDSAFENYTSLTSVIV